MARRLNRPVASLRLVVAVVLAGLMALPACVVSEAIVVAPPEDASWTFRYYDAHGEYLGHGWATVEFAPPGDTFSMVITENAFGDKAALEGRILRAETADGQAPFEATGTWFSGAAFAFFGRLDLSKGEFLHGSVAWSAEGRAAALAAGMSPETLLWPLPPGPSDEPSGRRFAPDCIDNAFSWSATRTPTP